MKSREIGNLALHIVGGAAMAAAVCWRPWLIVVVVLVFAWLREQAQHRWVFDNDAIGEPYSAPRKRTFFDFGWLGWKQVAEIFQWTAGAAVSVLVYLLIK